MWKCPKCGREFKNTNQDHYCGEKPKSIEEYILAQDEEKRLDLQEMAGLAEMYEAYIRGEKEIREINMEFNARYVKGEPDKEDRKSCVM